jgi:glutaminase
MGGWTDATVADVRADKENTKIYVNVDNRHISRLLHSGGYQETGVKRMKNSYLLYVAFYSWMQHLAKTGSALDDKEFDEYKERELDRASQLVVHTISAAGRLDDDEE